MIKFLYTLPIALCMNSAARSQEQQSQEDQQLHQFNIDTDEIDPELLAQMQQEQPIRTMNEGELGRHPIADSIEQLADFQDNLNEFFSQFTPEQLADMDRKVMEDWIDEMRELGSKSPETDWEVKKCWTTALGLTEERHKKYFENEGWQNFGFQHLDVQKWTNEVYNGKRGEGSKPWLVTVGKSPLSSDKSRSFDQLAGAFERMNCFAEHYPDRFNYGWIDWNDELLREPLNLKDDYRTVNLLLVQNGKLYHLKKQNTIDDIIKFTLKPDEFAAFTDPLPAARNQYTLYLSYTYKDLPRLVAFRKFYNLFQTDYNDTYAYQSIIKPLFSPLNRDQTIGMNIIVYIILPILTLAVLSLYLLTKLLCCLLCSKKSTTSKKVSRDSQKKEN